MMNAFFRRGFDEYRRHLNLKKSFERQTKRIKSIIVEPNKNNGDGTADGKSEIHRKPLLLLLPLVEIAWVDGRVSRREMDAIVHAAAAYGLVDDANDYRELAERLISRPAPSVVGRMWQDFRYFLENLTMRERQIVTFALLVQAQFVAEQSSDSVIAFLRGERVSREEREALRVVAGQLEKAKEAAEEADLRRAVAEGIEKEKFFVRANGIAADDEHGFGENQPPSSAEDFDKLIPIVPLVKVAWAEGRVTRRERELIFDSAKRMGIQPGSRSYQKLSDWFELHPTDEFYDESLEQLRSEFEKLSEDDKTLRRLDLLSDCVNVAEASGGTSRFPAGGARICEEEITVVKNIARRLNGAATV